MGAFLGCALIAFFLLIAGSAVEDQLIRIANALEDEDNDDQDNVDVAT